MSARAFAYATSHRIDEVVPGRLRKELGDEALLDAAVGVRSSPVHDPAREPASAGRRHAFVWIAQHDATEEELDGGAAVELDTPEAAWNAAVEVLARRMVRQFRLSPALAEPPRRTPAAANGADPGEHRPRAVAGQGA